MDNLKIALTPKGIGETFSALGIAVGLIFAGFLGGTAARKEWTSRIPTVLWWAFGACVLQALLGEWGRMLYYAAPFYGVCMGLILTHHPYFEGFRRLVTLQ